MAVSGPGTASVLRSRLPRRRRQPSPWAPFGPDHVRRWLGSGVARLDRVPVPWHEAPEPRHHPQLARWTRGGPVCHECPPRLGAHGRLTHPVEADVAVAEADPMGRRCTMEMAWRWIRYFRLPRSHPLLGGPPTTAAGWKSLTDGEKAVAIRLWGAPLCLDGSPLPAPVPAHGSGAPAGEQLLEGGLALGRGWRIAVPGTEAPRCRASRTIMIPKAHGAG